MDEELRNRFAKALIGDDAAVKRRHDAHEEKVNIKRGKRKVYFIVDGDVIKIGFSEYPLARLDQIKTSRPSAYLLGEVKGGTELEKEIHTRLSEWHFGREWFHYNHEVANIIKEYL
jgi:hypothetical protein